MTDARVYLHVVLHLKKKKNNFFISLLKNNTHCAEQNHAVASAQERSKPFKNCVKKGASWYLK